MHCHRLINEPSVSVTVVIPAKSVPEAWAQIPEALQRHIVEIQQLQTTPMEPLADFAQRLADKLPPVAPFDPFANEKSKNNGSS